MDREQIINDLIKNNSLWDNEIEAIKSLVAENKELSESVRLLSDKNDEFAEEIEDLVSEINKLDVSFSLTEDIIKELKQALRMCTPRYDDDGRSYDCVFCGENPHKEDCEYVKMCRKDWEG